MSMYIFEEAGGPFQALQSPRRSFGKELRCHPDMQPQFRVVIPLECLTSYVEKQMGRYLSQNSYVGIHIFHRE
jgi:hypothetical protein